jgi:hypothetical protein
VSDLNPLRVVFALAHGLRIPTSAAVSKLALSREISKEAYLYRMRVAETEPDYYKQIELCFNKLNGAN